MTEGLQHARQSFVMINLYTMTLVPDERLWVRDLAHYHAPTNAFYSADLHHVIAQLEITHPQDLPQSRPADVHQNSQCHQCLTCRPAAVMWIRLTRQQHA